MPHFCFVKILNVFFFVAVTYGVSSKEQESIVKSFLKNIFKVDVEQLLTAGDFPHHILPQTSLSKKFAFFSSDERIHGLSSDR